MKIGVCEKDLRGSFRETMRWAARNGFDGAQVWIGKARGEGLGPRETRAISEDLGLEIPALGGGPNLVDPARAQASLDAFREIFDFGAAMGCRIVTAETKAKPAGLDDGEAWRSTVSTVRAVCHHAESVGAVLAIEPSGPCFIRDARMFLELARRVESPALAVNYDPANIAWAGEDAAEGARLLGGRIVHTHAKDIAFASPVAGASEAEMESRERFHDVPAGEGVVDFASYLAALSSSGYDGFLTIEMHAGEEARLKDILVSARNLRSLLGMPEVRGGRP